MQPQSNSLCGEWGIFFFEEINILILKLKQKCKGAKIAKTTFKKHEGGEPGMKTVWYCCQHGQLMEHNREDRNRATCTQSIDF